MAAFRDGREAFPDKDRDEISNKGFEAENVVVRDDAFGYEKENGKDTSGRLVDGLYLKETARL